MKVCKVCQIPDIVGRDQIWNRDGTITITGDPRFRMGVLEVDLFRDIVARLETIVGPSIHNMFMEGKRKNARHYIDSLLKGPLGFLVRHTKAGGKKAYLKLLETSTGLGYGKVDLEVYERKQKVGGTIHDPYYTPLFMGDVRGAFESIERLPSKGTWDDLGDRATLLVERAGDKDKLEERFLFKEKSRLDGEVTYEVCEECGLPKDLKQFEWQTESGKIMDNIMKKRVFIMGLNDINAVFMELEEAIGDIVPKSVSDANREFGLNLVKDGQIKSYRELVKDMTIKGMGESDYREDKEGKKFIYRNPFNRHYLVGRSLGVFEGLEGMPGKAIVNERPGQLVITIQKE
jgi:hypothetical protein